MRSKMMFLECVYTGGRRGRGFDFKCATVLLGNMFVCLFVAIICSQKKYIFTCCRVDISVSNCGHGYNDPVEGCRNGGEARSLILRKIV